MNPGTSHSIAVAQTDLMNWKNPSSKADFKMSGLKLKSGFFRSVSFMASVLHLHRLTLHSHGLSPGLTTEVWRMSFSLQFYIVRYRCSVYSLNSLQSDESQICILFVCLFSRTYQVRLFPEMYLSCTWKKVGRGGAGWHILNYYILQNRLPVVSIYTL